MNWKLAACALFVLTLDAGAPVPATPESAARPIVARMMDRSLKQRLQLTRYSALRQYTLRNHHLSGDARMIVLVACEAGKGKHLSIVRQERVSGLVERVLHNLIKEEEELSKHNSSASDISPSNYQFEFVRKEVQDGRLCYRLKLIPRHKSKLLIAGDLWVDTKEFAIVCSKGTLSKNPSFWVSRAFVEQHFQKVNAFWMPLWTRSTAEVKLVGPTELTINCWDYKFPPLPL